MEQIGGGQGLPWVALPCVCGTALRCLQETWLFRHRGVRVLEGATAELTWPFASAFPKPLFMCQPSSQEVRALVFLSLTGCISAQIFGGV